MTTASPPAPSGPSRPSGPPQARLTCAASSFRCAARLLLRRKLAQPASDGGDARFQLCLELLGRCGRRRLHRLQARCRALSSSWRCRSQALCCSSSLAAQARPTATARQPSAASTHPAACATLRSGRSQGQHTAGALQRSMSGASMETGKHDDKLHMDHCVPRLYPHRLAAIPTWPKALPCTWQGTDPGSCSPAKHNPSKAIALQLTTQGGALFFATC